MRIQHNIMAMNAYRNYNTNTSALAKNLEKLSSGYKINRAGDDAAGLAISEKMRAQITGLNAAQKNVKDGISLVKTAEGAMQEIQDMLNRMDYLATQSANGTYDNEVDRKNLQKEVNQLRSEIDRIADSANFNGIKLLDGSQSGVNTDAFTIQNIKTGDMVPGASIDISGDLAASTASNPALHLGTANVSEQTPSFTVDLSDVTVQVSSGATGNLAIGFAGATLNVSNLNATDGALSASQLVNKVTDTTVAIGGKNFTVTKSGNQLNFTLATGQTLADADYTAINAALTGTNAAVTLTGTNNAAVTQGNHVHGLQNVVQAVKAAPGQKAGIDLTLDGDIVKDGQTLTIDDKTFVFKTDADSDVTAGEGQILIDVSGVKGSNATDTAAKQITAAAQAIAKDANNTANFQISHDKGSTIHIDQKADSTEVYDTYEKLTGVFSANAAPTAATSDSAKLTIDDSKIMDGDKLTIGGKTYTFVKGTPNADNNEIGMTAADLKAALTKDGYTVTDSTDADGNTVLSIVAGANSGAASIKTSTGLTLQIGDTSESYNQLGVVVGDMHVRSMGTMGAGDKVVNGKSIKDIDISNPEGASEAINVIRDAINYVSGVRGDLGATQNRLEHTANNLSVMAENIQDAESTIRDTDVAEEMMAYTKNNILVQSAQAMLAQANAVPQGVLQLLG